MLIILSVDTKGGANSHWTSGMTAHNPSMVPLQISPPQCILQLTKITIMTMIVIRENSQWQLAPNLYSSVDHNSSSTTMITSTSSSTTTSIKWNNHIFGVKFHYAILWIAGSTGCPFQSMDDMAIQCIDAAPWVNEIGISTPTTTQQ